MKCPHCHANNQEGLFCAKCGKPLDESVSDMTRVMPPLEEMHAPEDEAAAQEDATAKDDAEKTDDTAPVDDKDEKTDDAIEEKANEEANDTEDAAPDKNSEEGDKDGNNNEAEKSDDEPSKSDKDACDLDDIDTTSIEDVPADVEAKANKRKKAWTIAALVCGITLAALSGMYLFSNYFDHSEPVDPTSKVKNADTIAPDTSLAEDTIVGHWRHYNTGSVIEKIGTGRYRWTIGDDVYPLDFKENKYIYEDENGNVYTFVLVNADRIQLAESKDADDGLITNPVFESGYIAGRVGQDGTMTKNLSINKDAFNIVGRTYADLAGTYGPGSLSVVGDDQYIIFRADGGNFAVQFTGETVPLKKSANQGYEVVHLTNTTPTDPNTEPPTTTEPTPGIPPAPSTEPEEEEEDKEYKVEIPDMPTFPSNSAIATGVVWADLGFVIKNAPDTMSVEDLSAVLGISLEVGEAAPNASGFTFYGSDEGYFAGTYGINDHSYYVSGYGKNALSPDKTILFIEQIG